jgi:hypothetical protein
MLIGDELKIDKMKKYAILIISISIVQAINVSIATTEEIKLGARLIGDITGPGITTRFGFEGTDLGIAFTLPNGSGMFLFGDTFDHKEPNSGGWRSPTGLRSRTGYAGGNRLSEGIRWDNAAGGSRAKELTRNAHQTHPSGNSEFTVIPSDAISVNGKVYMFATSVHDWSQTWWMTNNGFVSVSGDLGENFNRTNMIWPNNGKGDLRQQITLDKGGDGWIYAVGSSFSRSINGMLLMRVRESDLATLDKNKWQEWGWTQPDGWRWRAPYQGTPFLGDACGETSLRKIQGTWILSYFDPKRYAIVTRFTTNIETPWSNPKVQVYGGSWGPDDHGRGSPPGTVAQLYGGYIHPASTLNELSIMVSQWRTSGSNGWPYRAMQFIGSI